MLPLPNSQNPYYIVTPPYVRTSAGVRCLHILCHSLNARGETAYIVLDPYHVKNGGALKSGADLLTPHLTQEIADEHFSAGKTPITIYHELVDGNPFEAECIVRLFLNFPRWTGENISHCPDELWYGYSLGIAEALGLPENVMYIPNVETDLFQLPPPDSPRAGSCFYADKYRKVHRATPGDVTNDSIEIVRNEEGAQSRKELAEIFRRSEVFYTYENTSLAIEAVLCGCPAIFIPNQYLQGIIGIERLSMDGFSWGLDPADVAKAKATVGRATENYKALIDRFPTDLGNFIRQTRSYAADFGRRGERFMLAGDYRSEEKYAALRKRNADLFFSHPFSLGMASLLPIKLHRKVSEFCGTVKLRTASSILWENCDFRELTEYRSRERNESRSKVDVPLIAHNHSCESLLELFRTMAARNAVELTCVPGQPITLTKCNQRFLLSESHFVYTGDLIENFDYYFRSTRPIRNGEYEIADYSKPDWHTLHSGERMFYTGLAEDLGAVEHYVELLEPKAGEVLLDVGAYCGLSTISFSRAVGPTGKVLAFEPDPENYRALIDNLAEAKAGNVAASNTAMSGIDGTLRFSSEGNMGSYLTAESSNRGKSIEVQALTMRSALTKYDLDRVDAVKLDIEGAEYSVVESSIDLVSHMGARWAVELHADQPAGLPLSVDRIRGVFDRAGYMTTVEPGGGTVPPTLFAFPRRTRISGMSLDSKSAE